MELSETFRQVWESWLTSPRIEENIKAYLGMKMPLIDLLDKTIARLSAELGEEPRVLEIGCGPAIISHHLAQRRKARYTAIDLSPEAVELARQIGRKMGTSVEPKVGDATKMDDVADGHYHLIFSQGVMEHFEDPAPFLRESVRVLNEKGRLVVDVPQKYNPYTLYKHRKMKTGEWPSGWETEYSYPELRRLGAGFGLDVVDWATWGTIPDAGSSTIYMNMALAKNSPLQRAVFSFGSKAYNLIFGTAAKLLPSLQPYFMMCISVVYQQRKRTA